MSTDFSWYHNVIHSAFHRQWAQPKGVVGSGLSTLVSVTIAPNGTILNAHIASQSGNRSLDSSVNRALHSVRKIQALPASLAAKGNYTIKIRFKLD